MRDIRGSLAFVLLLVGTAGLLANEFAFGWGRCATLTFAACNVVGLALLVSIRFRRARESG